MVEMRVPTQEVIVGVAVTMAGPGRHAGIGSVPADAARLGGLFGEPDVFVAAQSKRSTRYSMAV